MPSVFWPPAAGRRNPLPAHSRVLGRTRSRCARPWPRLARAPITARRAVASGCTPGVAVRRPAPARGPSPSMSRVKARAGRARAARGLSARSRGPLVYALHPSGEPAEGGPDRCGAAGRGGRASSSSPRPSTAELHCAKAAVRCRARGDLDAVSRLVHVDASRVYAFGYSKAASRPGTSPCTLPIASPGPSPPSRRVSTLRGPGRFLRQLVPTSPTFPLCSRVGRSRSARDQGPAEQPAGTFAESNRWFAREVGGLSLPITNHRGAERRIFSAPAADGRGLGDAVPAPCCDPPASRHAFRHLPPGPRATGSRASRGWATRGAIVAGARGRAPSRRAGGIRPARTLEPLLGRLTVCATARSSASPSGTSRCGHLARRASINWDQPVTIEVDGSWAFSGRSRRMSTGARSGEGDDDFERLCCAASGQRVRRGRLSSLAAPMPEPPRGGDRRCSSASGRAQHKWALG